MADEALWDEQFVASADKLLHLAEQAVDEYRADEAPYYQVRLNEVNALE